VRRFLAQRQLQRSRRSAVALQVGKQGRVGSLSGASGSAGLPLSSRSCRVLLLHRPALLPPSLADCVAGLPRARHAPAPQAAGRHPAAPGSGRRQRR
jgi:hypothetical protein